MTSIDLNQMWHGHTERFSELGPFVFESAEKHLSPDHLEGVPTGHVSHSLRHAVGGFGETVRHRVVEVVEDFRSPVIDGSDDIVEGGLRRRIEAILPNVIEFHRIESGLALVDVEEVFLGLKPAAMVASILIAQAIAATRWFWPEVPSVPWSYKGESGRVGMVTFIDREKVRRKRDYGRCYRRAGFKVIGETKGGLLALGIELPDMPLPEMPIGAQGGLEMTA